MPPVGMLPGCKRGKPYAYSDSEINAIADRGAGSAARGWVASRDRVAARPGDRGLHDHLVLGMA